MKKILLPVLIIALVALLLSSVTEKTGKVEDPAPKVTSVSEAAFSMRATGATDVSTRLVGNFVGENGVKLCFSGSGEVKRVAQNLNSTMGRYALLQSQSGASILELELAKPAEIINGTIVLYFTDEELFYASDAPCSIGLISSAMADSISGTLDMTSYPDMFSGDDYRGAAIIPSEPIPAGSYTFSVSIGTYLVSFDMTVE